MINVLDISMIAFTTIKVTKLSWMSTITYISQVHDAALLHGLLQFLCPNLQGDTTRLVNNMLC